MKRFSILMVVLTLILSLTACGGKDKTDGQEDTQQNQEDVQKNDQETATFTGILEEKKDFMVIVKSEDEEISYIFDLDDGVTCDAEVGDKITITYTGDITKFDPSGAGDEHLTATLVEKAA